MNHQRFGASIRKWIVSIIIIFLLVLVIYIRFGHKEATKLPEDSDTTMQVIEADLLGIGSKQQIQIIAPKTGMELRVLNNGQIVASKIISPNQSKPSIECTSIKLNLNQTKDYLRCDEYTGPHHIETRLLTIHQGNLYTIPSGDFEKKVWYEPFWASRDKVVISDVNSDGFAEIIEFVSEYPTDSPPLNDPEIEQITRREFEKQGISQELTENAIKILRRENYGKGIGRKVIWGIHTFTDNKTPLIRRVTEEEFDQIASDIVAANTITANKLDKNKNGQYVSEIIKVTDLDQESIDFNNLVRKTFGYSDVYEYPMADR